MVFDNDTLLARYNKRAAEAGGSRVQPRSKKSRLSSDPEGGTLASPSTAGSDRPRKDKEKVVERRKVPRVTAPASGGPTFGTTLSSRVANPPSSSAGRPSNSSGAHPPSSSSAHPPSSSGANPAGPIEVIIGSGGVPYDPEWTLFCTDSALEDGRVAREIVRGASLPIDRALLEVGQFQEFVDQTYCSAVRHLHEVDMMAKAVSCMRSRAQASDQQLQASKKDLGEVQNKLKEAEETAKKAESELDHANERTREIESEYVLCQSALRSSEAHAADLTSELKGKGREIDLLKLKLQQAEDREKKAVERAKTAVEDFRQSAEYQDELAEEAVDGLIRGFEDFREQAARLCPKIDFRRLRPRLGSGDDQDLGWVEELEQITLDVAPPILPDAAPEVISEAVFEGVGDPTAEVVARTVIAADLVIPPEAVVAIDPASLVVDVGDED